MKKGIKIALMVGLPVLALGGVATVIYMKKKKDAKTSGLPVPNSPIQAVKETVQSVVSPSKSNFQSKEEGDKFRAWVNSKYPDYAKSIELDPKGSHTNSYIRKAYEKLGAEYEASIAKKSLDTQGKVVDFNPRPHAVSINKSFNCVWGTDEDRFYKVMDSLTKEQREIVEDYYNSNNFGKGSTLEQMIRSEFSGGELKRALNYIKD